MISLTKETVYKMLNFEKRLRYETKRFFFFLTEEMLREMLNLEKQLLQETIPLTKEMCTTNSCIIEVACYETPTKLSLSSVQSTS